MHVDPAVSCALHQVRFNATILKASMSTSGISSALCGALVGLFGHSTTVLVNDGASGTAAVDALGKR